MPTFVKRFRRNLPHHFEEWLCSVVVLAIGILWLCFPASFSRQDYEPFTELWPARVWTTVAIMIGLIASVGLASFSEIPRFAGVLRSLMSIARLTFFAFCLGRSFAASDILSVSAGVVLYSAFVVLDWRNINRSWSETVNAFRKVRLVIPYSMVR